MFVDMVTKLLHHGSSGFAFVVDDPDFHIEVVLKLIQLGPQGTEFRSKHQKIIEKEMKVGLIIAKENKHLVEYSEVFEWNDYFCIKMEYCKVGDIQSSLDKGRIFTEEVFH
jgi:serine/threonine protein kinase